MTLLSYQKQQSTRNPGYDKPLTSTIGTTDLHHHNLLTPPKPSPATTQPPTNLPSKPITNTQYHALSSNLLNPHLCALSLNRHSSPPPFPPPALPPPTKNTHQPHATNTEHLTTALPPPRKTPSCAAHPATFFARGPRSSAPAAKYHQRRAVQQPIRLRFVRRVPEV